ncbi:Dcp1p-Dcp2p decapping enzyme complex alpha subunit [Orbilia oligospora]|uniref:mRNA-capping enzyme subunit alpha n=2 Tax=Orbilia oligospora TaxID=2813651 RepID=A0A7C8N2I7_ORBOL|nr:Dcp1p-Dcp2p decapping enzyme complex alpha subunit [Orbilia oligospora]KAF3106338.1 Dcp1p-Dcp2p decapping enzyme complex alpha subunit [Orbilia oligospora]KAF3111001.1 Dcp1p-Dcp2p decapping enzyme complex alpha subunit [Orbilia oligospora]KAF3121847.1 Dcp1p-Dcp2p decapping enzyme complex alpha subunit [Orbilia oligospora]KAF3137733.1 Dcp1p-Dcp2p decapping enzyme complex alpha subunit [Orbilia oligospora]
MTTPTIPGVKAEHSVAQTIRQEVARLLNRNTLSFPGAQPVSFAKKHLNELHHEDYYVCEKSDGIRCLLYCTHGDSQDSEAYYLIDRKNDYYYVSGLHYPRNPPPDSKEIDWGSFHTQTVIDGELVIDVKKDGRKVLKFLVFDCLVLDGQLLVQRSLDKRLGYFRSNFFKPYEALCKAFPDEMQYFPFYLQFKNMEFSYALPKMFDQVLPNLEHGNDGLIFTAVNADYRFGTDEKILKWKPADENSIDFRMNLRFPLLPPEECEEDGSGSPQYDWYAKPQITLSVNAGGGGYQRWAEMYVTDQEWTDLKNMGVELDERIVECAMDEEGRWRFKRFRNDKKDGNHISVVNSVMESIRDGVSKEDLLAVAAAVRTEWKSRHPPQQAQARPPQGRPQGR